MYAVKGAADIFRGVLVEDIHPSSQKMTLYMKFQLERASPE